MAPAPVQKSTGAFTTFWFASHPAPALSTRHAGARKDIQMELIPYLVLISAALILAAVALIP